MLMLRLRRGDGGDVSASVKEKGSVGGRSMRLLRRRRGNIAALSLRVVLRIS